MSKDYMNMTMEEYFTQKAASVENAIISHCEAVCNLIMTEYEEARSNELGVYEKPTTNTKIEMVVSLEAISGAHKGQIFPIKPKSSFYPIIGRTTREEVQDHGVSLPKDHEVSSYHGKFFIRAGQLMYKDTRSTNHSYVNGLLVDHDVTLKTGDILRVGQSELKVTIQRIK